MDEPKGGKPPEEDPIAARLAASGGVVCYTGLVARSSREGHWLIYLRLDMGLSVEVRQEDIVHTEHLSPEKSPFGSLGGSRVYVRKGSQVTITRTRSSTQAAGQPSDEFDLDLRLAAPAQGTGGQGPSTDVFNTCGAECGGINVGSDDDTCFACTYDFFKCQGTDYTCFATCLPTCYFSCQTCGPTCFYTCQKSCNTCNQATCHTCGVRCTMVTCVTCRGCVFNPATATCGTCGLKCTAVTCMTCAQGCVP